MSKKIDITMTATLRPSILDRTLKSFTEKMLTDQENFRLILNVDPIGEKSKPKRMLNVARKYFDDVVYNFPNEPCFSKAVIWTWSKTKSKYIFHLEDDWELIIPVNINKMIKIMEKHEKLAGLKLSKMRLRRVGRDPKAKKRGFIFEPKLSLNPNILRGDFVRGVFPLMDPSRNPEKQLRVNQSERGKFIKEWRFGVYTDLGNGPYVKDIGRKWMSKTEFHKPIGFTEWLRRI